MRRYVIVSTANLNNEIISESLDKSFKTVRLNNDSTKAIVKFAGETPDIFKGLYQYNKEEIQTELLKAEWSGASISSTISLDVDTAKLSAHKSSADSEMLKTDALSKVIHIDREDDVSKVPSVTLRYAPEGWSYHLNGVEFETSKLGSIVNTDDAGNDLGFATIKFYDSSDVELTVQATIDISCVKTVIDWEPQFDIQLIGGRLKQKSQPLSDLRFYCVGVPDIPAVMGGSKEFICCVNLAYIGPNDEVNADGRAGKMLYYDPVYHTNKMRSVFTHPAGFKHKGIILFEIYRA